ncbi:MAG: HNH endonuclease [Acetobacteraceae bacterium]|nr:HNH endonuclease [Acetobacteraceae bacterium]
MPVRPPLHRPAGQPARGAYDRERPSSDKRGYDRLWFRFRTYVLATEPLCRDCAAAGRITAATEVHHLVRIRDRPDLRLDRENVVALCKSCHSARTARGE